MAGSYQSWQDLLEEETTLPPVVAGKNNALPEAGAEDIPLPEGYLHLLREKEELEHRLKQMTGHAAPDPETERQKLLYPVKVHTPESRIEERQLRKAEEQRRLQEQRALERQIAAKKAEVKAFEQKEETLKELKTRRLLHEKWQAEKAQQTVEEQLRIRQEQLLHESLNQKRTAALEASAILRAEEERREKQAMARLVQQKARQQDARETVIGNVPEKDAVNKADPLEERRKVKMIKAQQGEAVKKRQVKHRKPEQERDEAAKKRLLEQKKATKEQSDIPATLPPADKPVKNSNEELRDQRKVACLKARRQEIAKGRLLEQKKAAKEVMTTEIERPVRKQEPQPEKIRDNMEQPRPVEHKGEPPREDQRRQMLREIQEKRKEAAREEHRREALKERLLSQKRSIMQLGKTDAGMDIMR